MEFFINKSRPRNNLFAPEWNLVIGETLVDSINTNHLAKLILFKREELLKNTQPLIMNNTVHDGGTGLGPDSLTSRFMHYNLFEWDDPEITKLFNVVKENYYIFLNRFGGYAPETYIQCWANVMDPGEKIKMHSHSAEEDSYLSGHFCVQIEKSETHYTNPYFIIDCPVMHASENQPGKLTIFQSFIPHKTSEHVGSDKRITIAFDIFTKNQIRKNIGNEYRRFVFFDAGSIKKR